MGEKQQGFNERLARKKRVQRMKAGLVIFLVTWMIVWALATIALIVKVNSLQEQMDIITENTIRSKQINQKKAEAASSGQVEQYKATDENKGEVSKKAAKQKPKEKEDMEDGEDVVKKVYLTFDDGPSTNTENILNILDQYQVKATFFVTGRDDAESLELYQEIVDRGNTIGMHSYSHQYAQLYQSLDSFKQDFDKIQAQVKRACGFSCKLYRFPGGSSNQVSHLDMKEFIRFLNKEKITYFDWNVECGDATDQEYTKEMLVDNVINDVEKYSVSVVLMHDAGNKGKTVEALPAIIKKLKKMDAEILPIDENTAPIQHITADSVEN